LRSVEEHGQLILQSRMDEVWRDVYAVDPTPVPMIDVEVSNWYVCTHPASRFVRGLTVGILTPEGAFVTLRGADALELVTRSASSSERRSVRPEEVPELLASHFGLPGFSLGADGQIRQGDAVVGATAPRR
jgi:arylamine N-acetyltransferase